MAFVSMNMECLRDFIMHHHCRSDVYIHYMVHNSSPQHNSTVSITSKYLLV